MCGLFGILSKEKVTIDKRAIAVLGLANDSRGGDACGLFIDGQVEYGTEKELVNFFNFFQQSELFKVSQKANVVLGHCRKASVGGKAADKAQPVVIKEGEEIKFVLLHNGTIKNYSDLAKKYIPDVDTTGMSDSQIMARIFYDVGYDCLGEYNGGAVFVAADYRGEKPIVRLWRGWAKEYSYSKEMTAERPLYLTMFNNRLVFSSISEVLQALYPFSEVKTVRPNSLCVFSDGKFYVEREFDRSSCLQTPTSYSSTSNAYTDDRQYYNGYGSHQTGGGYVYDSRKAKAKEEETKKTTLTPGMGFSASRLLYDDNVDLTGYQDAVYCDENFLVYYVNAINRGVSRFEFIPSTCKLLHGIYNLNSIGFIKNDKPNDDKCFNFAFYNGIMLKSIDCFKFLQKLAKMWCVNFSDMGNLAPYLVEALAMYPVPKDQGGVSNIFHIIDPNNDFSEVVVDGDATYPIALTQRTVKFDHGIISNVSKSTVFTDTFDYAKKIAGSYIIDNKSIIAFLDTAYD